MVNDPQKDPGQALFATVQMPGKGSNSQAKPLTLPALSQLQAHMRSDWIELHAAVLFRLPTRESFDYGFEFTSLEIDLGVGQQSSSFRGDLAALSRQ